MMEGPMIAGATAYRSMFATVLVFSLISMASATLPDRPEVGTPVVLKSLDTNLELDGKPVSTRRLFRVYVVADARPDSVLLVGGPDRFSGWAKRADVIPLREAVAYFDGILRHHPRSAQAYHLRGLIRFELDEEGPAIEDLTTAISLQPSFADAYIARGVIRDEATNYEAALADFNQAVRLTPDSSWAFVGRANLWRSMGKPEDAIRDYTEALRLDPGDALVHYFRALAWSDLLQEERALEDYTAAIRHAPEMAIAYNNRGVIRRDRMDLGGAAADFDEAIRLDPRCMGAYVMRGGIFQQRGDLDRALADYDEVVRISPGWPIAYCLRGGTRQAKGDLDRAMSDYDAAVRLDAGCVLAHYLRGRLWRERGENERALADLDEAIRLSPSGSVARLERAFVWERLRKHDRALRDLDAVGGRDEAPAVACWVAAARAWIRATCIDARIRDGRRAIEDARFVYDQAREPRHLDQRLEIVGAAMLALAHAEVGDFGSAIRWLDVAENRYRTEWEKQPPLERRRAGTAHNGTLALFAGLSESFHQRQPYREDAGERKPGLIRDLMESMPQGFSLGTISYKPGDEPGKR
jgi:tetratricopeptide (TPR) repeat protein